MAFTGGSRFNPRHPGAKQAPGELPDVPAGSGEDRLQSAIPSASSTRVSSTREWIPSLR